MTTRWHLRGLLGVALVAASFGRPPSPALAADDVVGSGAPASCTEAAFNTVLSTVQGSGGGTITFNCGAAAHTITFTTEKSITAGVTVNGAGLIRLSGNNATRLFNVQTGATLTLAGLTLTAGSAGEGGAILNNGRLVISDSQLIANRATSSFGGAISSYGPATLTGTDVISNVAPNIGGGIYNQSQLTINGGRISGNSTTGGTAPGGGLYSGIGTAITLTNASLINNIAADGGGGLYALSAATTLANTIVSGNSARFGGGISQFGSTLTLTDVVLADNGWVINPQGFANEGGGLHLRQTTARLERVTLSNNAGQFGGGVWAQGSDVRLLNTTVSGNRSTNTGAGLYATGGGVHLAQVTVANNLIDTPSTLTGAGVFVELGSSLVLTSTLLSGNRLTRTQASANCGGAAPTASASLSSDGSCALGTGRDNVALPLGPLQNNGGFTPTHLLPQGSPAIDAGSNSGCPAVDQRGQARPVGATCDVGAIEARASDFIQQVFLPTLQK